MIGEYELILFDLDGVLADTTECHRRAFDDLWTRLEMTGPPYDTIAGRKTVDVVREIAGHRLSSSEELGRWVHFKQEQARHYLRCIEIAYDDSVVTLRALVDAGMRLSLGTGASRETALMILERMRVLDCFERIATAEDVQVGKPSPEIYTYLLESLNVVPERGLVIEDSVAGLQAGIAAGCHVISVRTGNRLTHPRFRGAFPDLRSFVAAHGVAK